MQKRENPYTPGAGRKPPILAGRDRDREHFRSLIERLGAGGYERSLIYSGLRGVDKTVPLMELLERVGGWLRLDDEHMALCRRSDDAFVNGRRATSLCAGRTLEGAQPLGSSVGTS